MHNASDKAIYVNHFGRTMAKLQNCDLPAADGVPTAPPKIRVAMTRICPVCHQDHEHDEATGRVCMACLNQLREHHAKQMEKLKKK